MFVPWLRMERGGSPRWPHQRNSCEFCCVCGGFRQAGSDKGTMMMMMMMMMMMTIIIIIIIICFFWLPCFEHESKPKDEIHHRILDLCFGRCSFYILRWFNSAANAQRCMTHLSHDTRFRQKNKNEWHIISINIYNFGTGIDWHAFSYTHILQWFYSPVGYQQEVRVPCEERQQQDLSKSPPHSKWTMLGLGFWWFWQSNHQWLLWFLHISSYF